MDCSQVLESEVMKPRIDDGEWLVNAYVNEGRSTSDIAKEIGCSPQTVANTLYRLGAPVRAPHDRRHLNERHCDLCSEVYQPTGPASRYCPPCGDQIRVRAQEARTVRSLEQTCTVCGVVFKGTRTQQTCSLVECRQAVLTSKRCYVCQRVLPLSAFGKDKTRGDGLNTGCFTCRREESRRNWQVDIETKRLKARLDSHRHRCKKMGWDLDLYERLFQEQDGRCASCGDPAGDRGLNLDHNHSTGKSRGLLCTDCNAAIGHLREDPVRFQSAMIYLSKYES